MEEELNYRCIYYSDTHVHIIVELKTKECIKQQWNVYIH